MALKKSELYSSLWKSCDELRAGMDASQYKDYVLVLLFVKYVSDKNAGGAKGLLTVPPGSSFPDLVKLKGDPAIGEQMTVKITELFTANGLSLSDVRDFNDPEKLGKGKEMVDRLSNLLGIFDTPDLDFRGNRAPGDDLLGDAYEFLMRHFATESGKSKGQFYTPAEVSRVMAKVVGVGGAKDRTQTIYDPTCGSGSLLLKAHDEAQAVTGFDLAMYGQEMDQQTSGLARMNMMLHNCPTAEIWKDNVLATPFFKDDDTGKLKAFDFVVANPPFSFKSWTSGFTPSADPFARFALGVPPAKNGDMAFLLHILASLKSTGKAAVNLPHGVLFRGNAEASIRRQIVQRGYVKAVIGLPPNLFYGTGIPACIVVLDKENAGQRKGVFLIDARKGYVKDGNKNRLRAQDIHRIVDAFQRFADIPKYSRMVPLSEIADPKNDYNLNIPRYVDASEPEDLQDIGGHLRGGIPVRDVDALADYWAVFPGVREPLFRAGDRPCYLELAVRPADIKAAIFGHKTFAKFQKSVVALFEVRTEKNKPKLRDIKPITRPKTLIEELSEALLGTFRNVRLIDPYDVYQHLMTYWADTMQDDVYAIVASGWVPAAQPRRIVEVKGKKTTEKPNLVVSRLKFKTELIPLPLLVAKYFAAEQEGIDAHTAEEEKAAQQMEQLREEHGGEDGLLADVIDDKGKVTKGAVTDRRKKIKKDKDAADELAMLTKYQGIMDRELEHRAKAREATEALHELALEKFGELTEDDVKTLVVEDKWLAADVRGELDRVSRVLTGRVAELAARYSAPLPALAAEADTLAKRVQKHLAKMGAA